MKKIDYSGTGNVFSRLHRNLEANRYFTDIDATEGKIKLGCVTIDIADESENEVYHEYKLAKGSECITTAIFDYKFAMSDRLKRDMDNVQRGSSLWYQNYIAGKLGAKFYVVVADRGELPLTFYRIENNKCVPVGILSNDYSEIAKEFWKCKLEL